MTQKYTLDVLSLSRGQVVLESRAWVTSWAIRYSFIGYSSCADLSLDILQIPTLSICFREGEHPRDGWPPADVPARSFFKRNRQIRYHV